VTLCWFYKVHLTSWLQAHGDVLSYLAAQMQKSFFG
jgi:hypothetical protein